MPTVKLTKTTVAKLPAPDPSGKQTLYWDQTQPGFGLLVSGTTTAKTYVVQRSVNGKKRRVTLGRVEDYANARKTVEDAREDAANLIHDLRQGKDPKAEDAGAVTLQRALDDYLAKSPNLAERTREAYRAHVEGWFAAWLKKPLRDITPDMIETRYHAIRAEVARAKGKRSELFVSEPGAATANAALRSLRAVWHFAHGRTPELPAWPAARLKRQWHRVGRRERHVRADDLPTFYAAVNETDEAGEFTLGRDMRDLALLMLFTGLRRGEACGLRWRDVDFTSAVIRLPAKATKSKRPLDLPMSDLVKDLLVARRALGVEGDYVFPGRRGRGREVSAPVREPKKAFATLSKRCGFAVNPHALRATFITIASNAPGVTPLTLKALVNHAVDESDVTSGYARLTPEDLRGPAQAVADRLKAVCMIESPEFESAEAGSKPVVKKLR